MEHKNFEIIYTNYRPACRQAGEIFLRNSLSADRQACDQQKLKNYTDQQKLKNYT